MTTDNPKKITRLEKLISLFKSLQGKKPDYNNLNFSNWKQTEEEYQDEQKKWITSRKKKENK